MIRTAYLKKSSYRAHRKIGRQENDLKKASFNVVGYFFFYLKKNIF